MISPFVLTVGLLLLIIVPETTGFSICHSPWRPHRLDTAFRLYSTPTIQSKSASMLGADELRNLYSEIAYKDPQWLKEFVIEMFDDEDDEDLLAIIRQAETNAITSKANVSKKESPVKCSSTKAALNVSTTPIRKSPVETIKNEIKKSSTNATVNETAAEHSFKNTTDQIVEQKNNTTTKVIEKASFERKPFSSEQLLDRRSQSMKRDDSSQANSNQQSTSAYSISNTTKENPSLENDRVSLATNTSTSFNSSQTSVKRNEPLPSPAMKLPNTNGSIHQSQNASRSGNDSKKTVTSSAAKAGIDEKIEKVVVFSDSRLKKKQKVSLSKLIVLGYTTEEILSLDPDALSLIVEDTLRRPSTGVPTSWKNDKNLIKIESSDDFIDESFKSNSTKTPSPEFSTSKTTVIVTGPETEIANRGKDSRIKERRGRFNEITADTLPTNNREQRRKKPTKEVDGATAPTLRASAKEERTRRVFTGRPAPGPPRDDPPPPKAFWPDIDTFRSLLRKEAALRLKVLGDGWSQTVRDESEWRLDLYKNWLWTLHTGVGDPLVESRSDRMRRSSINIAKAESTTKGNSSNEQRQRRQREE